MYQKTGIPVILLAPPACPAGGPVNAVEIASRFSLNGVEGALLLPWLKTAPLRGRVRQHGNTRRRKPERQALSETLSLAEGRKIEGLGFTGADSLFEF